MTKEDPLARHARLYGWLRREGVPLGFYAEHWKSTLSHPGTDALRRVFGRQPADREWYITGQLIQGVIHAAGGVEYTVAKLIDAMDAEQAYLEELAPEMLEPQPHRVGFAWHNRDAANYEFANLLVWLKTLKERLKNQGATKFDFGLINALAQGEPWTLSIQTAYEHLNDRGAFAYHRIANFATHISPAPQPFGTFEVENRRLVLRIPDPPQQRIENWAELTYSKQLDARKFATDALAAVEEFMNAMITAFEEAKSEIERRRAATSPT